MRRAFLCLATSIAIALTTATPPVYADDQGTARQHFERGKMYRDDGECNKAIPEFEKSLAAEKSIGSFYNLGFCNEQLGHRQEAYDAYKSARELASAKKDDRLREISGAIASLLETPHIRLVLPSPLPDGIKIKVDDQPIPENLYQTETVIFTKASKTHAVFVTAPGYEDKRELVETKGVRAIELRHPGKAPTVVVKTEGGWSGMHWAGVGLTAAGLAMGAIALVVFLDYDAEESRLKKQFDEANAACGSCSVAEKTARELKANELKLAYERNERDGTAKRPTIIAFGVGGGLALAAGVVFFVLAPPLTAKQTTEPSPSPSPSPPKASWRLLPTFETARTGASGLMLQGTF
jgi:tetratricopeptide (TPR) repeat protein